MTSQKVVKWKCDHFHLSNLKKLFAFVIKGMAASLKTVGSFSFFLKNVTVKHPMQSLMLVTVTFIKYRNFGVFMTNCH